MALDSDPAAGGGDGGAGAIGALLGGAAPAPAPGAAPPAPGVPAAGAGDPPGAGGDPAAAGADPDWYGSLSAEPDGEHAANRDYAKSKGWKSLDDVVKSYRETERWQRDSGRVKVPGEGAGEDEVKAFRAAIGVPETAAGYKIEAPVGADGKPLPVNNGLLKTVTEAGVKHGIPKGALEAVLGEVFKHDMDAIADATRQQDDAAKAWVTAQGAQSAEKQAAIGRACEVLGLTAQDMTGLRGAWGAEKALTFMAKLGEGMAEDRLISGDASRHRFGVSGEAAKAELDKLKLDLAFVAKATVKGTPENVRWNRLNAAVAAYEGSKAGEQ